MQYVDVDNIITSYSATVVHAYISKESNNGKMEKVGSKIICWYEGVVVVVSMVLPEIDMPIFDICLRYGYNQFQMIRVVCIATAVQLVPTETSTVQ